MPKVGRYCKAYPVERLREFDGWGEARQSRAGDGVLFLQEDFSVTEGVFLDEGIVFDRVTPEWKKFCEEQLGFRVPEHIAGDDVTRANRSIPEPRPGED